MQMTRDGQSDIERERISLICLNQFKETYIFVNQSQVILAYS